MLKSLHGAIASSTRVPRLSPILPVGWNIATASYGSPGVAFDVGTENSIPLGVTFSADGTRMYMLGVSGDDSVYQYDLSTAWDLSTASYGSPGISFSVASDITSTRDVDFSADGTNMYVLGDDAVFQYDLSTAWDISSASFGSPGISFSVSLQDPSSQGITFKPDGTIMYMTGSSIVYQYELSIAWDVSSASYGSPGISFDVSSEDGAVRDVSLKTDGTRMFVVGRNTDSVYQYELSTAWDVSSASYGGSPGISFDVSLEDSSMEGMTFKTDDGTKIYLLGFTNTSVYQYDL